MNLTNIISAVGIVLFLLSGLFKNGMPHFHLPAIGVWVFIFVFASLPAAYGVTADRRMPFHNEEKSPFQAAATWSALGILLGGVPTYIILLIVGIAGNHGGHGVNPMMAGLALFMVGIAIMFYSALAALVVGLSAGLGAHLAHKLKPGIAPLAAAVSALLGGVLAVGLKS